jgi:signal transduction histidine kinase
MKSPYPKCLLVDDLEENLLALRELLKHEELETFSARSGEAALELMLQHDFAVALLDVQMPGMDGFELAEFMRSTERTRHIPIIFVTAAGADAERVFKGYDSGAVDFLTKPLSPKIVLSKIRVFLELHQQKLELQEKIERLKDTEARLQKALRARDEFISVCSHELKTPLTSLKMQSQIVGRNREKLGEAAAFAPERMDKFIGNVDRSVDRIIHLVNDMLDISRVQTGRLSLNREQVGLRALVTEVLDRMRAFLEMAGCGLEVNTPEEITVEADRFRLEQVLTNLLTNAAKYAPECPVRIELKKEGSFAVLSVIDRGEGISPENQAKIFERFERVDENAPVGGLGLGLYISREIMQMHRGSLSVQSTPGEGATFLMKVPLV